MNGVKLILFGISVVLYAGFLMVAGHGDDGTLFWLLSLGLAVSVGGLLTSDGDGRPTEVDDGDGTDDGDGGDGEDEGGDGDADGDYYAASHYPPM